MRSNSRCLRRWRHNQYRRSACKMLKLHLGPISKQTVSVKHAWRTKTPQRNPNLLSLNRQRAIRRLSPRTKTWSNRTIPQTSRKKQKNSWEGSHRLGVSSMTVCSIWTIALRRFLCSTHPSKSLLPRSNSTELPTSKRKVAKIAPYQTTAGHQVPDAPHTGWSTSKSRSSSRMPPSLLLHKWIKT